MVDRGQRAMAATKITPPSPPSRFVDRARLDDVLDAAVGRNVPLVLVSAPAGSGKSTLVSSWLARRDVAVAWLQVDDGDVDPAGFWSSLVSAVSRSLPSLGEVVAPLVIGSQGDDRVVVPAIVNELVADGRPMVVVIDDYHLVENAAVHRGIERLIELCPPHVTVVLATRLDPPFRLGRMRVRDRVVEVRAAELRFAADEAVVLLGTVGSALSPQRVEVLCARTEGWAAGLVLAGLSLERTSDPDRFVDRFGGDDQLVVGYLGDELLDAMDDDDRRRLLDTSVLDRLSGPLVDAVTGSSGGAAWLASLADRNQLVVRLDSTGEWFRCHHLLHDLLALEARRSAPERLPVLHARAARWFESEGRLDVAVTHHLAADDADAAVPLMRVVGPDLLGVGQVKTLRTILGQIGPAADTDAVCALLWGWCEYLDGRYEAAQQWLDVVHEVAPPSLDLTVAAPLMINVALGRGDVGTALAAARTVSAEVDLTVRPAELATAVGAALTWAGLVDQARVVLATAIVRGQAEQRRTAHVLALVSSAIVELEDADVPAARVAADRAITTAESFGLARYHGVAPAFAVRARTEPDADRSRADAHHAVQLARRATTDLGRAFVLVAAGDTLARLGDEEGATLLREARALVDRCADAGYAAEYLARAEARHRMAAAQPADVDGLVEQLTEREMAVLRFLPTGMSQREIAAELYVSMNTVKTHCSAIFRKLAVGDRAAAVQAARRFGLL